MSDSGTGIFGLLWKGLSLVFQELLYLFFDVFSHVGTGTMFVCFAALAISVVAVAALFQWWLNHNVPTKATDKHPNLGDKWIRIEFSSSLIWAGPRALQRLWARFFGHATYQLKTDDKAVFSKLSDEMKADWFDVSAEKEALKAFEEGKLKTLWLEIRAKKDAVSTVMAKLVELGVVEHIAGRVGGSVWRARIHVEVMLVPEIERTEANLAGKVDEGQLIASLGPSYLLASVVCAALYAGAMLLDPFISKGLELSAGLSAWEYLFLGWSPPLQTYLPLSSTPQLAVLLALAFWTFIWSNSARLIRIMNKEPLGRNLYADRAGGTVLRSWGEHAGLSRYFEPDKSYKAWAQYVAIGMVPLLIFSFFATSAAPYRVPAGGFAVTFLAFLGWFLNLWLEGLLKGELEPTEEEAKPEVITKKSWLDVLKDLHERYQTPPPIPLEAPRPVPDLELLDKNAFKSGVINPMLAELIPSARKDGESAGGGQLTRMQHEVLSQISNRAQVTPLHVTDGDKLEMVTGGGSVLDDDEAGQDQVVVSPEGSGKTTLAMLAACNHVVTHTQRVLMIAKDEVSADALYGEMMERLQPSTLRWTTRVKRAGAPLLADLAAQVFPDIVVASLREMATDLLDGNERARKFLAGVGLIVLEDIEEYSGAPEVHAQLLFRRLTHRLETLSRSEREAGAGAAIRLALCSDSMENLNAWAAALLGATPRVRRFGFTQEEALAQNTNNASPESQSTSASGRVQTSLHISELKDRRGEPLTLSQLIDSCERLKVPWCYRVCGDATRDLGRAALLLEQEPESCVDCPEDAGVVFLAGAWSDAEREHARLRRAGGRFSTRFEKKGEVERPLEPKDGPDTIALVSLADPDAVMAFTQRDVHSDVHRLVSRLPKAVVPQPKGIVPERHLSGDLVREWTEVGDLVRIYGAGVSDPLRSLAEQRLLHADRRIEIDRKADRFVERVMVHALGEAVREDDPALDIDLSSPTTDDDYWEVYRLPPAVDRIDHASNRYAEVEDRSTARSIAVADEGSAYYRFYPRRIFVDARGRYQVLDYQTPQIYRDVKRRSPMKIFVDPMAERLLSAPRNQAVVRLSNKALEEGEIRKHLDFRFVGAEPIALFAGTGSIAIHHVATYHLHPETHAVIDRILKDPFEDTGADQQPPVLNTEICLLYPCPDLAAEVNRAPDRDGQLKYLWTFASTPSGSNLSDADIRNHETKVANFTPDRVGDYELKLTAWRDGQKEYSDTVTITAANIGLNVDAGADRTTLTGDRVTLDGKATTETVTFEYGGASHRVELLTLRQARLLTAAMRMALRTLFRGAEDCVGVTLKVPANRGQDEKLTPKDAIVFFDLQEGGNGFARQIFNEHLVGLLRLTRLIIERVLHQGRLMALYDHWGDKKEVAEEAWRDAAQESDMKKTQLVEEKRRHGALAWLDSRLRPEGRAAIGSIMGLYAPGQEEGEGDSFDLGRCWYSLDDSVGELLWAKHRWRMRDRRPAALDVGIGRRTVSEHVHIDEDTKFWAQFRNRAAAISNAFFLDEEVDPPEAEPTIGDANQATAHDQGRWVGLEAITRSPLSQLAPMLQRKCGAQPTLRRVEEWTPPGSDAQGPSGFWLDHYALQVGDYVAAFVQGIPHHDPEEGKGLPRSPVEVVIGANGDPYSSSFLLARLYHLLELTRAGAFIIPNNTYDVYAGLPVGYFHCVDEGRKGEVASRFIDLLAGKDGEPSHPHISSTRPNIWGVEELKLEEAQALGFDVTAMAPRCIICGRELSAEDSQTFGIGPDCRKNNGYDDAPHENRERANEICVEAAQYGTTNARRQEIALELEQLGFGQIAAKINERVGKDLFRPPPDLTSTGVGYYRLILPVDTSGFYRPGFAHAPTPDQWLFVSMEPPSKAEQTELEQAMTEAEDSVDDAGEPLSVDVELDDDDEEEDGGEA